MTELNNRYAFAERWYSRRLSDAHRLYETGMVTDREYWDMVGDDALVALAYRARIKVRLRQEAWRAAPAPAPKVLTKEV